MDCHEFDQELDRKNAEIERLVAKLAADLAEVSFRATELQLDIWFADRSYLQGRQELIDAPEAGVAAEHL